jgi:bifunctional non-homologous end joining protein LigD
MTKASRKDTGLRPQLLTPISEEEAEKYLQDDHWCLGEKKDGDHVVSKVTNGKVTAANKQGLEKAIPKSIESDLLEYFSEAVLDGELIGVTFHVFDILEYLGTDYRVHNYDTRYALLTRLFPSGKLGSLILVPSFFGTEAKTREFDKIKAQQKEGVVFKKISAVFSEGRPETGGDMVKCKFWASLSAIVSEEETGKSSFVSYVLDEKTGERVDLGRCSALGKVMPKAGDVVEIRYLYWRVGGKLIQPTFIAIRDDVAIEECTTKQLKAKCDDRNI